MTTLKRLFALSIYFIASSCSVNKQHESMDVIKSNEVAFIEFYQTQEGEVISGVAPQGRRIDGPTYRFNKTTKQLEILRKPNFILDTVKVILGNGKILKGSAGNGLSMRLSAFSKIPITMNSLTISKVSSKGIQVFFDKKDFLIKEGESWQTTSTTIDTIKMETPTIIRTKTTYTINYLGKIDKKSIIEK